MGVGSKKIFAPQRRIPLGEPNQVVQSFHRTRMEGGTMTRELQMLAVGFVFVFLGAIVVGVL
jgi:hypothetical protein